MWRPKNAVDKIGCYLWLLLGLVCGGIVTLAVLAYGLWDMMTK